MKNIKTIIKTIGSSAALAGALALAAVAQTTVPPPAKQMPKPVATTTAKAPVKNIAAKSDGAIQSDIQKRLAAAPKLKSENISVAVSGGVATFTGSVKNAGSKGGVNSLAKAAGAKSVVNNLTVEKPANPVKK